MLLSAVWIPAAMAASLGEPEIRSYLNEPLDARIELADIGADEVLNRYKVGLSPPLEWAREGLGAFPEELDLKLAIRRDQEGHYVAVTSGQPVSDPVLQLLVDLQPPNGALTTRSYVLFLDPKPTPGDVARQRLAATRRQRLVARAEAQEAQQRATQEQAQQSGAGQPAPAAEAQQPAAERPARAELPPIGQLPVDLDVEDDTYGPIKPGETLWAIAIALSRSNDFTPQQWLVALQRKNPHALANPGNVNTLRSDVMLQVPRFNDLRDINQRDAINDLRQQNLAWSNSGGRLEVLAATTQERSSQLNNSVAALRIARLEEQLLALQRENEALREQIELLNGEIEDRDREIGRLRRAASLEATGTISAAPENRPPEADDTPAARVPESLDADSAGGPGSARRLEHEGTGDLSDLVPFTTMLPGREANNTFNAGGAVPPLAASLTQTVSRPTESAGTPADESAQPEPAGNAAGGSPGPLAAVSGGEGESWWQSITWLPGSLSGLIVFAALALLLIAALFWTLRALFGRASGNREYRNVMEELDSRRRRYREDTSKIQQAASPGGRAAQDAATPAADAAAGREATTAAQPEADSAASQADREQQESAGAPAESSTATEQSGDTGEWFVPDDSAMTDREQPAKKTGGDEDSAPAAEQAGEGELSTEESDFLDQYLDEPSPGSSGAPEAADDSGEKQAAATGPDDAEADDLAETAPLAFDLEDEAPEETAGKSEPDDEADLIHEPLQYESIDPADLPKSEKRKAEFTFSDAGEPASPDEHDPFEDSLQPAQEDAAAEDFKSTEAGTATTAGPEPAADAGTADTGEDAGEAGEEQFDSTEVKLDLARAYKALGDYQAMQVVLDEIGDQATPGQRREIERLRGPGDD